ncbi:hypothetical protein Kostya_113 [Mycobacterium phage Kostya]|uniref:dATP/dGTP diphosphohydrolase N-terminal domain-containing protein n=1 Tax=Mycobacterium phage Kostya TaxID=2914016 RepID=B5A773_9CAUD|nr:hypothetical protein Kostya_113 [Mycobacterium phage Kostya]ACF34278.1 hypothetical protein Kostya_113 [Mycobacterium phage Kostya]
MSANEVIHTSETGARKAGNLERYDLLPVTALQDLAYVYGSYEILPEPSFNVLNEHLLQFWDGVTFDAAGIPHMAYVAFHALELVNQIEGFGEQLDEDATALRHYDRIPAKALRLLAEHYGKGSLKYDDNNWRKGYDWGLSYAALNRHLWSHWAGETFDPETGSYHLIAVAWHAFALLTFTDEHPEFDSRWSSSSKTP